LATHWSVARRHPVLFRGISACIGVTPAAHILAQVHLEAARLLAFTEDEFMKTLDWKV
jgi:hypothetical protein